MTIYLKRGLTMFVLCLLICSPVQKNTDAAFLIIQREKLISLLEKKAKTTMVTTVSYEGFIFILALLYRAEM